MVDYVRTPFSRARPRKTERDAFSDIPGVRLVATTLNTMMDERLTGKVSRDEVDQFIMGNAFQVGDNITFSGKLALWEAKFPHETPAFLVERQCGSGMTAMHQAFMNIKLGYEDITICSSFEHQTREPMHNNKHLLPDIASALPMSQWYNSDLDFMGSLNMLVTAQKLYEMNIDHFTKEDMDKYGVRSHNLAEEALNSGYFKDEIVPILGHVEGDLNKDYLVDYDLSIRKGATLEDFAKLRPVSTPGWAGGYQNPVLDKETYVEKNGGNAYGVITAGNASPLNVGAATTMLMSKEIMEEKGLEPMARIVEIGWAAVDPSIMGLGPVPATRKALKKAGLTVDDIDYWEINEAFCIVALNAIKDLVIKNADKTVNVHGGATAIGHPLSATGIRMPGTLARILKEKKAKYGLANMCCGGGHGTAIIIENMEA